MQEIRESEDKMAFDEWRYTKRPLACGTRTTLNGCPGERIVRRHWR
jgi:hypothetical protein